MAICLKTGLIINDEDINDYDVDEAIKQDESLLVPKGKAKKQDGTIINLPKKQPKEV